MRAALSVRLASMCEVKFQSTAFFTRYHPNASCLFDKTMYQPATLCVSSTLHGRRPAQTWTCL